MKDEDNERIEEINDEIEALRDEIADKNERMDELDGDKGEEEFNDMIDDVTPVIMIGNISFTPSRVLKELDEIAYNCGMGEYQDEEKSELESDISDKEDEIKELQKEKEGLK